MASSSPACRQSCLLNLSATTGDTRNVKDVHVGVGTGWRGGQGGLGCNINAYSVEAAP